MKEAIQGLAGKVQGEAECLLSLASWRQGSRHRRLECSVALGSGHSAPLSVVSSSCLPTAGHLYIIISAVYPEVQLDLRRCGPLWGLPSHPLVSVMALMRALRRLDSTCYFPHQRSSFSTPLCSAFLCRLVSIQSGKSSVRNENWDVQGQTGGWAVCSGCCNR